MAVNVVLYTDHFDAARDEIVALGGRITHQFAPTVFVARLPDDFDPAALTQSTPRAPRALDPLAQLAVDAWELRGLERASEATDPTAGLSWDAPGMTPPGDYLTPPPPPDEAFESTGTPTSLYMVGSIGVGIVLVSGQGDLAFATEELALVIQEVQEGLDFLANVEPRANLTFVYDIHHITVDVAPGPTGAYESAEAPWRNAALSQMGFPGSPAGSAAYVSDLAARRGARWAVVAYFTKYPLRHFAYALLERLVMAYTNDGWGTRNINSVFAHEFCHLFGAADEYGNCSCAASGHLGVLNKNCIQCGPHVDCLMDQNRLVLCEWSRGQIGWDPRLFPPPLAAGMRLVSYKKGTGQAGFGRIAQAAQGILHASDRQWAAGWTAVKPVTLDGAAHLVRYNAGSGMVALDRVVDDGQDAVEVRCNAWITGATFFDALSSGSDLLLLGYAQRNGAASIDLVQGDAGIMGQWRGRWLPNLTVLERCTLDVGPCLLKYRAGDGAVMVDVIDTAGPGATEIWSDRWDAGWTTVKPFVQGGSMHLFLYDRTRGRAEIKRLARSGQGVTDAWAGDLTPGWSTFVAFELGGASYLIGYKVNGGTVAINRIEPAAAGLTEIWREAWLRGWSALETFA